MMVGTLLYYLHRHFRTVTTVLTVGVIGLVLSLMFQVLMRLLSA